MPPEPIYTSNLLLRTFRETDLEAVHRGLSHEDVIRYYGVSYPTVEAARAQMKFFADLDAFNTGAWWAVCSLKDEKFLGACGINNYNPLHMKAELGFWLLKENWGRGIMKEAIPKVCSYAFSNFALHRIEAFVEMGNGNSFGLLTKLGFRHEGVMVDCEIKNDKFISLHIFATFHDVALPH